MTDVVKQGDILGMSDGDWLVFSAYIVKFEDSYHTLDTFLYADAIKLGGGKIEQFVLKSQGVKLQKYTIKRNIHDD